MMWRRWRRILSASIIAGIAASVVAAQVGTGGLSRANASGLTSSNSHTARALGLHDLMRKLWEEHVTWTRLVIVSDVADLPDLSPTLDRLLRNQSDIGTAFASFYGTAAGNQLTSLLVQHIQLAAAILADAKSGNQGQLQSDEEAWYANANDIAAFLHGLNPRNWPLADLRSMMKEHLDLTLTEAVDQLNGNFAASVAEYDLVETEILGMADTLSRGIVEQFPQRF